MQNQLLMWNTIICRKPRVYLWQDFSAGSCGALHISHESLAGGTDSMLLSTGLQLWSLAAI